MIDKASIDPSCDFRVEWSTTPGQMDAFWERGWRHFGPFFFRRYFMENGDKILAVQPLRINLARFKPSKSQRRVLRRNAELATRVAPTVLTRELREMFEAHVERFALNVPPNLESFLGDRPDRVPCQNVTVGLYDENRLLAASFLDLGTEGVSSVYGIFDPVHSWRSLGILTMLHEMEYARQRGCRYYYPGYACHEASPYDYKKQFSGLEWFDWRDWRPLERGREVSA